MHSSRLLSATFRAALLFGFMVVSGSFAQPVANDPDTLLLLRLDGTPNGVSGEIPLGPTGLTYVPGVFGQAAYFGTTAATNNVFFSAAGNIDAREGTLEFWLKSSWKWDGGRSQGFLTWGEEGGVLIFKNHVYIRSLFSRFGVGGIPEAGASEFLQTTWTPGVWHHVAFTWSNRTKMCRIFIDGVQKAAESFSTTLPLVSADRFQLGAEGTFSDTWLDAAVDDLRISRVARTPDEINATYRAGASVLAPTMRITSQNLLVNGDFEQSEIRLGSTVLPGWTVEAGTIDISPDLTSPDPAISLPAQSGTRWIELTGTPGAATISQTIPTTPGTRYQLKGWATVHAAINFGSAEVRVNGELAGSIVHARLTSTPYDWEEFEPVTFIAKSAATKISIKDTTEGYDFGGMCVDALSVSEVFAATSVYAFSTAAGFSSIGSADGNSTSTRFNGPSGAAVDASGNLYIVDTRNHTLRRITPAGVVTTLAGTADRIGSVDGAGSVARFNLPLGVALDNAGNGYIADSANHTIRKITPAGIVSTFAGAARAAGDTDGAGKEALFDQPTAVAVDNLGNVYVCDGNNRTIRKITPAGIVTTLAGTPGETGTADGAGAAARFVYPAGIAVDGAGNLFVADGSTIRKITATGVVSTFAGSPSASGSADGTGRAARFDGPRGLAVDGAGSVYVADYLNHRIRKISPAGVVTTLAGSATSGAADGTGAAARFDGPYGLAVGSGGIVYVADVDTNTIRRITSTGVVTTIAGSVGYGSTDGTGSSARFNYPNGVAVDGIGIVYIADTDNHTIRKMTSAGAVTTFAGAAGSSGNSNGSGTGARFASPKGIALDGAGNAYVADTGNSTIRKITPGGGVTTLAGVPSITGSVDGAGTTARFNQPGGVATDSAGNIYVADTDNFTIRKITPAGVVTTLAGQALARGSVDGAGNSARFSSPRGIAVDTAGTIYVADTENHVIRKISPAGAVTTLAGSPGEPGIFDGVGRAARFRYPSGLAMDAGGNIYVADTDNHTIRKISPAGLVVTIGGSAEIFGSRDGAAAAARFYHPCATAVDRDGRLYVADVENTMIRVGLSSPAVVVPGATIPGITIIPRIPETTDNVVRALASQSGKRLLLAVSGRSSGAAGGGNVSSRSRPIPRTAAAITGVITDVNGPPLYSASSVLRMLDSGKPDPTFTSTQRGGTFNTLAVQVDNKILVGGDFVTYNAKAFQNLARLLPDGADDPSFADGGPNGEVNAIALQGDGRILVGGAFTMYDGPRPFLVRLHSNGTVDTTFAPALNGRVNAIAVQTVEGRENIYVGGNFTAANGASRMHIARLLENGRVDPAFNPGAGSNKEVVALLVQSNGSILAAGDFTSFANQRRERIVRILPNGDLDPSFLATASADETILALGLQADGKIVLGGAFNKVNNVQRRHLARLHLDGTLDTDFDPGTGADGEVRALVMPRDDGVIFLTGSANSGVTTILRNASPTTVTVPPQAAAPPAGGSARLTVEAVGTGLLSYQWYKDGIVIPGATSASLTVQNATAADQGTYTVQITSSSGNSATSDTTLTLTRMSYIVNFGARADGGTGSNALVAGFVVRGTGSKQILLRAAGPALAALGVTGAMPNPHLRLYKGAEELGMNQNWDASISPVVSRLGAFPFTTGSLDAALLMPLEPGSYTAIVADESGRSGLVLAEAYDADPNPPTATARLDNLSLRARVGAGEKVLIPSIVVAGDAPLRLLIRGIGPRLADFGLLRDSVLADPVITLARSDGVVVATNDDWNSASNLAELRQGVEQVGAFALVEGAKDAALLISVPPGEYTLTCSGKNGTEGIALVEVYTVP